MADPFSAPASDPFGSSLGDAADIFALSDKFASNAEIVNGAKELFRIHTILLKVAETKLQLSSLILDEFSPTKPV